jgi:predicted double-glycine peptidase
MDYKYNSKSSLNFISLHDATIQDFRVIGDDLYLYVNMINMTTDVVENSFDVAKQTDEALIVLSDFKIEEYTKDYGDKVDTR